MDLDGGDWVRGKVVWGIVMLCWAFGAPIGFILLFGISYAILECCMWAHDRAHAHFAEHGTLPDDRSHFAMESLTTGAHGLVRGTSREMNRKREQVRTLVKQASRRLRGDRGTEIFHPGKITSVNGNGTYGILYDNGNRACVEKSSVRSPPAEFARCEAGMHLSNGSTCVTKQGGPDLTSCLGADVVSNGSKSWEFKVHATNGNTMIGIARPDLPLNHITAVFEDRALPDSKLWFIKNPGNTTFKVDPHLNRGAEFNAGDVIRVDVSLESGTVSFFVNGVAHASCPMMGVVGPVTPFVNLDYDGDSVTISAESSGGGEGTETTAAAYDPNDPTNEASTITLEFKVGDQVEVRSFHGAEEEEQEPPGLPSSSDNVNELFAKLLSCTTGHVAELVLLELTNRVNGMDPRDVIGNEKFKSQYLMQNIKVSLIEALDEYSYNKYCKVPFTQLLRAISSKNRDAAEAVEEGWL